MPEVWLRGALAGVPLELQPVVHALLQVDEDIVAHGAALPDTRVWMSPGGISGLEWAVVGMGLLVDLGAFGGGGYSRRHRD